MGWLQRFLAGRHGPDQFSFALTIFSIVLTVVFWFVPVPYIGYLAYIPFFWALFRILSRQHTKRYAENQKYLSIWNPVKNWVVNHWHLLFGSKTHKFYRCKQCKQLVRVPKGRGKIVITCPKCQTKFTKKT